MIDNRLKKCCNECNHIDAFADTKEELTYRTCMSDEIYPAKKCVFIGCKHMYVCKKYIENQEVE